MTNLPWPQGKPLHNHSNGLTQTHDKSLAQLQVDQCWWIWPRKEGRIRQADHPCYRLQAIYTRALHCNAGTAEKRQILSMGFCLLLPFPHFAEDVSVFSLQLPLHQPRKSGSQMSIRPQGGPAWIFLRSLQKKLHSTASEFIQTHLFHSSYSQIAFSPTAENKRRCFYPEDSGVLGNHLSPHGSCFSIPADPSEWPPGYYRHRH